MNDIELMTKQKMSTVGEENKKASIAVKMKHSLWAPWKAAGVQAASEQIVFQGKIKNPWLSTRSSFLPFLCLFPMDYGFHVYVFFGTLLTACNTEVAHKQFLFQIHIKAIFLILCVPSVFKQMYFFWAHNIKFQ